MVTGGSLAWVKLSTPAFDHIQCKRVEFILNEFWTGKASSLQNILGTITINTSMWDRESLKDLIRASKDAEQGP